MLCVDEEPSIDQPVSVAPSLSAIDLKRKENEARQRAMEEKRKAMEEKRKAMEEKRKAMEDKKKKIAVGKIGKDGWIEHNMAPHYRMT